MCVVDVTSLATFCTMVLFLAEAHQNKERNKAPTWSTVIVEIAGVFSLPLQYRGQLKAAVVTKNIERRLKMAHDPLSELPSPIL